MIKEFWDVFICGNYQIVPTELGAKQAAWMGSFDFSGCSEDEIMGMCADGTFMIDSYAVYGHQQPAEAENVEQYIDKNPDVTDAVLC